MVTTLLRRSRSFSRGHPRIVASLTVAGVMVAIGLAALAYVEHEDIPTEARRLVEEVGLDRVESVADVGAGTGRLTIALWHELRARGASPRMWATELDSTRLAQLRRAVADDGASVTVLAGTTSSTELPDGCCDVIVMRTVYHHLADPAAMNASLRRALKPGGRLVVIDFSPVGPLRWAHVQGTAERREGHGVSRADLEQELSAAGFRVIKELVGWHPVLYAMVFERVERERSPSKLPAS